LKLSLLGGVHAVGGPDQKTKDQGEQQGKKADDTADHIAGALSGVVFRELALQKEADAAASDDECADDEGDRQRIQERFPRARL
jgi:hypothetical protein